MNRLLNIALCSLAVYALTAFTAQTPTSYGADTYTITVAAGPLFSDEEAQNVGPKIAAAWGGKFTGKSMAIR